MIRKKALYWMVFLFVFVAMNLCNCRLTSNETVTLPESSSNQKSDNNKTDLGDEKSLLTTTGHWKILFADNEMLSPNTKINFLLGKVENGKVELIEKRSWDKMEKAFLEYDNHTPSNNSLTLSISSDGQFLAYYGKDGLVIFDRGAGTKTVLEKTTVDKSASSKHHTYIRNICWSSDNRYVLLQYITNEATAVFLYDLKQNKKLSPSGNGFLSGSQMIWAPDKNIFLDPSSDGAYGDPGLYQSDSNNLKKYSDISASFGLHSRLFFKAAYHPDGNIVALITNGKPIENQIDISHNRCVSLLNLLTKQVINIDQGTLIDSLFFSPDGNRLYYFIRDESSTQQTWIMSYDLTLQNTCIEGYFQSDKIDIREAKWIDAHSALLEVVHWNEDHSFKQTQIIGLDFSQKNLLYCSQPYPFEIKLLAVDTY